MRKKASAKPKSKPKAPAQVKSGAAQNPPRKPPQKNFLVVGLGASAGGIKALKEFFDAMPPDSGMAFVVILHLAPQHESSLSEVLQTRTKMPVNQVKEPAKVEPNHVYVIPPMQNLEMTDGIIRLAEPEIERGKRVAIDVFFRSMAEAYERNAVCVVLSGTGTDGTLGLKRVKESNGFAIVQDPNDAEYDGMPRSAITTQLADWILPVAKMPEKLINYRQSSEKLHLTDGDDGKVITEIKADESLREILTLLRIRTGHDFSNYKTPTLIRRIARHLQSRELEDIPSYLNYLRENPQEIQSLLKNLLINVTNFFRDKEAFEALEKEVIPRLFENKTSRDMIRVWVTACASGEEAYSIAILLSEYSYHLTDPPNFQIFASDVDEDSISEAREHRYPASIETDVSPERLRRFFVKEGNYYRIKKDLRETILFAPHNILRDPPFSRLDMISCRNLLIYLNRETQEKVLQIFHFALNPHGYLLLGSSESAETASELYTTIDKKQRIFSRRPAHQTLRLPPSMPVAGKWQVNLPEEKTEKGGEHIFSLGEVHFKLLEQYAPPSVLVDENFEIVYMSRSAGRFLRFSGGEPSNNLLKLIHPNLLGDVRAALFSAQRENKNIEFQNIGVNFEEGQIFINLIIRPVEIPETRRDLLLVIFDEGRAVTETKANAPAPKILDKDDAMETVVNRLEDDLRRTKDHLRATIEQHETSVEELRASNEELQAINEELRSATEELETSKEELQSVNEELITVNQELKEKIEETSRANSDLQNFMSSTAVGIIFLDRFLNIKRFTPLAQNLFNIEKTDIGRPLEHFTNRLNYENLKEDAENVLTDLKIIETEIQDSNGVYYLARFRPYLTVDDRIDGVVMTFVDINERKKAEEDLRQSEEKFRTLSEVAPALIWFVDSNGNCVFVNRQYLEFSGKTTEDLQGKNWHALLHPEDSAEYLSDLKWAQDERRLFYHRARTLRRDGEWRWLESFAQPLFASDGSFLGHVGISPDITGTVKTEEALRKSEERLNLIVESAKDFAIITFDLDGRITLWSEGAERIFGYSAGEIVGQPGTIIFTPEDRVAGVPELEMKRAMTQGRAEDERWHLRKDGSRFFASGVMQPLRDGKTKGYVKITRDETERLKAERAINEKTMLAQLVNVQEDERRRIAREIHDHLGQQLTVLRLKLDALRKMCDEELICMAIEETQEFARQLDSDVDFLAWELRPAALDDLGLKVTLANFVKEWSGHTLIKAKFHTSGLSRRRLDFETETNLYRIAQEALNNIQKHAEAENVSVLLEKRDHSVALIVEDDGRGFDPEKIMAEDKQLGLAGMSERTKLCGGTFEIESEEGKGTTVFARVPIKQS